MTHWKEISQQQNLELSRELLERQGRINELTAEVRQLRAANTELAISNDALAFQSNAANSDLSAKAGRADLDAFERLIGSLTAELRLLRQQREQVLALADECAEASEGNCPWSHKARAIFSDTRTPDRQPEGN